MSPPRVAIIGAGPAGLVALKTALEWGYPSATAFEARADIGGVWDPEEMYDALTTNLPHPLMAFPGFPFPEATPLFPRPPAVRKYLHDYADHFQLRPHIRLSEFVSRTCWQPDKSCWELTIVPSQGADYTFDADLLLVCNGHYNLPRLPSNLPSLPNSCSFFSHSHDYRRPIPDFGSRVLVVGGGPSGQDIIADLSSSPSIHSIVHSMASPSPISTSNKITPKPRTLSYTLSEDYKSLTAYFADGSKEEGLTHCILATGYEMSFPFLSYSAFMKPGFPSIPSPPTSSPPDELSSLISSGDIYNTTYSVFPLYKHLIPFPSPLPYSTSTSDPRALLRSASTPPPSTSIAFLSLLYRVAPLPVSASQARLALAAFAHPESINWQRGKEEVLERWATLGSQPEDSSKVDASGSTKPPNTIMKEWHRFEPLDQFKYRDDVDEVARRLLSSTQSPPALFSLPVYKVRPWEWPLYELKDLLRRTWRYLEETGQAEDWVEGVGSYTKKQETPHEPTTKKSVEEIEEEWVELMWKVAEFGRKREAKNGKTNNAGALSPAKF